MEIVIQHSKTKW